MYDLVIRLTRVNGERLTAELKDAADILAGRSGTSIASEAGGLELY